MFMEFPDANHAVEFVMRWGGRRSETALFAQHPVDHLVIGDAELAGVPADVAGRRGLPIGGSPAKSLQKLTSAFDAKGALTPAQGRPGEPSVRLAGPPESRSC